MRIAIIIIIALALNSCANYADKRRDYCGCRILSEPSKGLDDQFMYLNCNGTMTCARLSNYECQYLHIGSVINCNDSLTLK